MKTLLYLFVIALTVGLAAACNEEEPRGAEPAPKQTSKKEEKKYDGGKIYKKYCVSCHGVYGNMGTNGAKDLTKSELSREERTHIVVNGKGVMTPWGGILNDGQVAAVVDYTFELGDN